MFYQISQKFTLIYLKINVLNNNSIPFFVFIFVETRERFNYQFNR